MTRISTVAINRLSSATVGLLHLAIWAAVGFLVLLGLLHILKPELSPTWRFISEYEIGSYGWLMHLAFFCAAIASLGVAVALWSQIKSVPGRIGLVALVIAAIGMILAGIYTSDTINTPIADLSPSGKMHALGATLGIPTTPIAVILICLALGRRDPAWAKDRLWIGVTGGLVLLTYGWFAVANIQGAGKFSPADYVGIPNRLFMISFVVWLLVLSAMTLNRNKLTTK